MVEFVAQWSSHSVAALQAFGADPGAAGSPSHDAAKDLGLVQAQDSLNRVRAALKVSRQHGSASSMDGTSFQACGKDAC